jgi:antitoxin (DNA-binding transcriptional repressor) of toxin-antitoxin stability system
MIEMNVRDARKQFSELLDKVNAGEDVIVLRRGLPVARLTRPEVVVNDLPSLKEFRASMGVTFDETSSELLRDERDER